MLSTPLKALLGVLGAIVVVGVVGYVSGAFDRFLSAPATQIAAVPPAPVASPPAPAAQPASTSPEAGAAPAPPKPAEPAAALPETKPEAAPAEAMPAAPETAKVEIVPPSFDILRVETGGSIVIAGKAPAGSKVEILAGSKVIGSAMAGPGGDFAVVIDNPLAPGSYQIVLRATDESNTVAMSTETAVVSIPEKPDGQVLALVEQPGQPSKLITVPEPMTSTPTASAAEAQKPADAAAVAEPARPADATTASEAHKPADEAATTAAAAPAQAAAPPAVATAPEAPQTVPAPPATTEVASAKPEPAPAAPPSDLRVEVRAIEIEGNKVFVAGLATPKKAVRAYANEIMLGDARASATGEFLVEALVDLPVGDYIVRADLLDDSGNKVLMRAQVPFRREAGEAISAVAAAPTPVAPQPPAVAAADPAKQPAAPAPAAGAAPATEPAGQAAAPAEVVEPAAPAATAGSAAPSATAQAPAPSSTMPAAPAPAAQASAPAAAPSTGQAGAPAASAAGVEVAAAQASAPAAEAAVPKPDLALPTEPPSVTAAPLQPVDGAVIIRRGDSLWRISRRVYGRGVRYSTIYLANQKQIADPDRIWPGQVFTVPVKTGEGETANMDAVGGQAVSPEDLAKYPPVR
jgi:nucleoid-associated protein YgaU